MLNPSVCLKATAEPGFKAYMQAKDLNIVIETAREYGISLPSAALDAQFFNAMLQMGMENMDNSAVIAVIESLSNTQLL